MKDNLEACGCSHLPQRSLDSTNFLFHQLLSFHPSQGAGSYRQGIAKKDELARQGKVHLSTQKTY